MYSNAMKYAKSASNYATEQVAKNSQKLSSITIPNKYTTTYPAVPASSVETASSETATSETASSTRASSETATNTIASKGSYGDMHFISFFAAILARLAYFNDNKFLKNYNQIMGKVIDTKILTAINNGVKSKQSQMLLNEKEMFKDFNEYPKTEDTPYLDVVKMKIPQQINKINGEQATFEKMFEKKAKTNNDDSGDVELVEKIKASSMDTGTGNRGENTNNNVKYISIGWSNYGEVYVVADKRMPNTLMLLFRGTYSIKTASIYTKATTTLPLAACNTNPDIKFLYGIYKVTAEMIHTIIEAMRYLVENFLNEGKKDEGSIKIFTTGHSLGGAMCTIFAYLWMSIKKVEPYNKSPYNVFSNDIICVSLGAPRCMNETAANDFCEYVMKKKILYLRIVSNGDVVTAMPPSNLYYVHPCSNNNELRQQVTESCVAPFIRYPFYFTTDYKVEIKCSTQVNKDWKGTHAHAYYLYISYLNGISPTKFVPGFNNEVVRMNGNTVCRLIYGWESTFNVVFFNVEDVRDRNINGGYSFKKLSRMKTSGLELVGAKIKNVVEDTKMTSEVFDFLIKKMNKIKPTIVKDVYTNCCPMFPPVTTIDEKLTEKKDFMPNISCIPHNAAKSSDIDISKENPLKKKGGGTRKSKTTFKTTRKHKY